MKQQRLSYFIMMLGGAIGMVSAFLQTLEKLVLMQNKEALLPCNINAVFNCSAVLSAPQSSVFGFPNSIMCTILFTIFFSIGLAGFSGVLSCGVRLGIQGLTLFTFGFALWFLWQSTYVIGALCIFCIFCFAGLLMVNAAWLHINIADIPLRDAWRTKLHGWIKKDYDIVGWVVLALVVAVAMAIQFL